MDAFLLIVHILVSLLLIIVVLLQSGKAADLAGAFGGMGSQSTFGPRGAATILSKITTTLAILFMLTSLLLWLRADIKSGARSVMDSESVTQEQKTEDTGTPAKKAGTAAETTEKKEDKTSTQKEEK